MNDEERKKKIYDKCEEKIKRTAWKKEEEEKKQEEEE